MNQRTIIPTTRGPITSIIKTSQQSLLPGGFLTLTMGTGSYYKIQITKDQLNYLWTTNKNLTVFFEYHDETGQNTTIRYVVKTENICTNQIQKILESVWFDNLDALNQLKIYIFVKYKAQVNTEDTTWKYFTFNYEPQVIPDSESMTIKTAGGSNYISGLYSTDEHEYTASVMFNTSSTLTLPDELIFNTSLDLVDSLAKVTFKKTNKEFQQNILALTDIMFATNIQTTFTSISSFPQKVSNTSAATLNWPSINFYVTLYLSSSNILNIKVFYALTQTQTTWNVPANSITFGTLLTPNQTYETYAVKLITSTNKGQYFIQNEFYYADQTYHIYQGYVNKCYNTTTSFNNLKLLI